MNKLDPMNGSGPNGQRVLFDKFAAVGNGFSAEQVIGAAMNLLVNAVRQAHSSRQSAMKSIDGLTAGAKNLLGESYDATGKRRNVFAFNQNIDVPLLHLSKKNGHGG